jgi:phosphohistidine phosphatase
MRQLFILRHAQAEPDSPTGEDADRPLTPLGRAAAGAVGKWMRGEGLEPDHVFVSPSVRTRETLEALGAWDDATIDIRSEIYEASLAGLLDLVRLAPGSARAVLLIGHNPGLHALALTLAGDQAPDALRAGLPTATLVVFDVRVPWAELTAGGVTPRLVRRPG